MDLTILLKLVLAVILGGIIGVSFYCLHFAEDKIQGRKSYSYFLIVTNLNEGLSSINRVLQDCGVPAASFNFKKNATDYRVWFNLFVPRERNLAIIEQLSELPEVVQVETGSTHGISTRVVQTENGKGNRYEGHV